MSDAIPQSGRRRRRSWLSPIWLVPVLAAAAIGAFLHQRRSEEGPTIHITFKEGEGLQAGKTDLRYRGIKLGQVEEVKLSDDLKSVTADVQLVRTAEPLAKEGSEFWIVRPRVSLTGVQGLGTIVSGAYIEVKPGKGSDRNDFQGLNRPPPLAEEERGLEVEVFTGRQGALEPETPVFYRGVQVGAVDSSGLSPDSRGVVTKLAIERPYRELVRRNSKFWNAGGVKFDVSLFHGVQASAKSFSTLVRGGIAFATPDPPGPLAKNGEAFPLADKADKSWLEWNPSIRVETKSGEGESTSAGETPPESGAGS